MNAYVAPDAIIEDDVHLGEGVRIWHRAQVRSGARIGAGTTIGTGAFIDAGVTVGENCKIQNAAQIYAPAVIEDGVFIGPGVILTNDLYPRAVAQDMTLLAADEWTSQGCRVSRGASLGAGSIIVCTEVGPWALVAAGAVVTKPLPAHSLAMGVPAHTNGYVCFCGKPSVDGCSTCGWSPS